MQVLGSTPDFVESLFFNNVCLPAWVFPSVIQFSPTDLKKTKTKTKNKHKDSRLPRRVSE